jgi:hypothetical protein
MCTGCQKGNGVAIPLAGQCSKRPSLHPSDVAQSALVIAAISRKTVIPAKVQPIA